MGDGTKYDNRQRLRTVLMRFQESENDPRFKMTICVMARKLGPHMINGPFCDIAGNWDLTDHWTLPFTREKVRFVA
jgi:hypothetical protein